MTFRILITMAASLLLAGCERSPQEALHPWSPSEGVLWEGRAPVRFLTDSSGTVKVHTLDFPGRDSLRLRLREYASEVQAFQAFQAKASPEELRQGFYREKHIQVFYHGPFLGELQLSRGGLLPATFLKDRLAFSGEELFRKPAMFQAFPIAGRIGESERILTPEFLGANAKDPLIAVAYECHQDTALLFRGLPPFSTDPMDWISQQKGKRETLRWGRERRFSGVLEDGKPLVFWNFRDEVVGVWGCYDEVLALAYAEKMKKTASLSEKP